MRSHQIILTVTFKLLCSTRDDDGIITRLTNELSQKNAELNARTFALNHANLQMSALEGRDQESRTMVAQLRNELSLAQQDNLLLEVRFNLCSLLTEL